MTNNIEEALKEARSIISNLKGRVPFDVDPTIAKIDRALDDLKLQAPIPLYDMNDLGEKE